MGEITNHIVALDNSSGTINCGIRSAATLHHIKTGAWLVTDNAGCTIKPPY